MNYNRSPTLLRRVADLEREAKTLAVTTSWDPDSRPGPVPGVDVDFILREKKVHLEFRAIVKWNPATKGVCEADVDHYDIQLRASDKNGNPKNDNRKLREHVFKEDIEGEEDLRAVFEYIPHPKTWYWQGRVRVVDKAGRRGFWSDWSTPKLPFDSSLPRPPTPTGVALDFDKAEKGRHGPRHRAIVRFDEVTPWDIPPDDNTKEDTQDSEDDVRGYQVQLARVNPKIVDHAATNKYRQIGDPRSKYVASKPEEDDPNAVVRVVFPNVRKRNWFQARVRSIDRFNRQGKWSDWTLIGTPSDRDAPPKPINFIFDIDQTKFILDWEAPEDPDDTDSDLKDPDPDIAFFQCQVAASQTFNRDVMVRQDRYVHAQHKVFKVKKPGGTYWSRVRSVDGSGNKSAWVVQSVNTKIPPAPSEPPTISFERMKGTKDGKYRVDARFRYNENNYPEDHINFYHVQLQVSANNGFNDSDPRRRERVDDDEEKIAHFRRVKARHYVRTRHRAVDRQGRKGPWSAWSASVRLVKSTSKPTTPRNVRRRTGKATVGVKWDPAPNPDDPTTPDPQVTHYHAQLATDRDFSNVVDQHEQVVNNYARFPVDNPDQGYFTRVASVDEEGNYSDWIYDTWTQEPPSSRDEPQHAERINETYIDENAVTSPKLAANAVTAKHKIVGAKIMTSDDPTRSRIVIKEIDGENDKVKWYGSTGNLVGYLQAQSGDVYGGGDFALEGLQVSNDYDGAPSRNGWARLYLGTGSIQVVVRRYDGTVRRGTLAYVEDGVPAHDHPHDHDGRYYTKDKIDSILQDYSKKGHSHGSHSHAIEKASDGHGHGQRTGSTTVS